jgi:hypothetical protein
VGGDYETVLLGWTVRSTLPEIVLVTILLLLPFASIANASATGNEVTINTPANGQTVSGTAVAVTVTLGPDVYWDQLQRCYQAPAISLGIRRAIPDGTHTLTARVFKNVR